MTHGTEMRKGVTMTAGVAMITARKRVRRRSSRRRFMAAVVLLVCSVAFVRTSSEPVRSRRGMVASQKMLASQAGLDALAAGGSAVDAAVATAFALAVTLPRAGNVGGGGFMVFRPDEGDPVAYDFRETAPAAASPDMWLRDGEYDPVLHHASGRAVGVPGTVAGLHEAGRRTAGFPGRAWSSRPSRWRATAFSSPTTSSAR